MKDIFRLLFFIFLVGGVSFFQGWENSLFSIKPNWALITIIAAAFFTKDIWEKFLLVAVSILVLKFSAGLADELLVFGAVVALLAVLQKYLPWDNFLNNLVSVAAGTILFYLLLAKNLILSTLFFEELLLNLIFGTAFFALFNFLWENKGA